MEKKQRTLNNKGFSLIELIVVIAIMAILVGVLAPQFIKYVESSRQSTDIQNAAAVRSAVEVGVANGDISSNVTVEIDVDATSGICTIKVANADAALTAAGLTNSIACKSSGWNDGTIGTYDVSTYKWTAAANTNNNAPGRDISSAFK
ncbi:MAG: type II secretion system protein [Lachnospiraceae bacterium]|nr:type II secretion system protein [Lachnospiraceae bacterium]